MLFFYLSGCFAYAFFLAVNLSKDTDAVGDFASWRILVLASLFWPIVIPLSWLEVRAKKKKQAILDAMPKPTTMSDGSIRYIKQTVETEAKRVGGDLPLRLQPEEGQ